MKFIFTELTENWNDIKEKATERKIKVLHHELDRQFNEVYILVRESSKYYQKILIDVAMTIFNPYTHDEAVQKLCGAIEAVKILNEISKIFMLPDMKELKNVNKSIKVLKDEI